MSVKISKVLSIVGTFVAVYTALINNLQIVDLAIIVLAAFTVMLFYGGSPRDMTLGENSSIN